MKLSCLFTAVFLLLLLMGSASAFSTLSLSKVDFSSNDPTVGGTAWLLSVVENGNGQHAEGTFTPNDIKRADGATTQKNIKIEIDNTQNTCQYSFQNQYTNIEGITMLTFNPFTGYNDCTTAGGYYFAYKKQLGVPTGFECFVKTTTGKVTPLSTPTTTISSTIKATIGTETVSGTVTNTGQRSVNLGTRASANWEGNLVSGEQCPAPLDTGVMGAQSNGQFLITSKAAYDGAGGYTSAESSFEQCLASVYTSTLQTDELYQTCADNYNQAANRALQKTTITPFSTAAIGNGQASVTLSNLIQYPLITMRVRADWIGIVVPVGKPQIVSVTTTPFSEASSGNIRAVIKNVGDGKGNFVVSAQCTAPTAQAGIAQTLKLDPGMSGFVDITVTGQATGSTKTAACVVTAQDINQPTNIATTTVTVTVNPLALCTPTATRCLQNTIQQCNQAGTAWIDSQTCLNGCTTQNGQPVCQNAEICTTDSQCDDHDPTTVDACVGVVQSTCQHKVIPPNPDGFDFGKYWKLLLCIVIAVLFGVGTTILAETKGKGWYALHLITGLAILGALFNFVALFSTLAAILLAIGLVCIVVGVPLAYIGLAPYALFAFGLGIASIIIALILTFVTLPGWLSWL